ncbi:BglG family transcription antiterminator [Streptococcus cameli]
MEFSTKELLLLSILSTSQSPLTAIDLSTQIGVSTKTVYRMIKRINSIANMELVISHSGKGILLDYESYIGLSFHKNKYSDVEKRRMEILLRLLYFSPKSVEINYLFENYYLSDSVILNDIASINKIVEKNKIKLVKSFGRLSIVGKETDIRNLIDEVNQELGIYSEILSDDKNNQNSLDIDFVTNLFKKLEFKIGANLNHPYSLNIFSHLYILIQRGRHGFINQNILQQDFISDERELIEKNSELYRIAEETINAIRSYLNVPISTFENFYLFFHLLSSRFEQKEFLEIDDNDEIKMIAKEILDRVGFKMSLKLDSQANIADFETHLGAMLYRLKNRFSVKNELLDDIKKDYENIFNTVSSEVKEVLATYSYNKISDDEIGFITLYFVKYKEEAESVKRVLIMCSSGVGTSELLKTRVMKTIPNIEIVDVISVHLYRKRKTQYKDIDLILTTVNYNDFGEIPSILVSVLFNEQDATKVRTILGGK